MSENQIVGTFVALWFGYGAYVVSRRYAIRHELRPGAYIVTTLAVVGGAYLLITGLALEPAAAEFQNIALAVIAGCWIGFAVGTPSEEQDCITS